ncbi:MAG TPA: polysaccharide biosynthesis/export family protein [Hyphomicrobium sp.]|jgi:polysaccharide export outer membrane protein|nr:polysaccharide biosynthesis/export family protein [Hyphomicrobium sp.]
MSVRILLVASAAAALLGGCASGPEFLSGFNPELQDDTVIAGPAPGDSQPVDGYPVPITTASARPVVWGEPTIIPAVIQSETIIDPTGPYRLDTGDRLRIFVYGQPNLSRLYIVDHEGKIAVPLIGNVTARGKTTNQLQATIRARLGSEYVKDPQVTVDIQQNRPFFILGEVKNAGQFPYVSGMTVETAVAIAGGYTERASERTFRITRKVDGVVQQIEAPSDTQLRPGDTVYVFERFF